MEYLSPNKLTRCTVVLVPVGELALARAVRFAADAPGHTAGGLARLARVITQRKIRLVIMNLVFV